jgi:hypothetical protein
MIGYGLRTWLLAGYEGMPAMFERDEGIFHSSLFILCQAYADGFWDHSRNDIQNVRYSKELI